MEDRHRQQYGLVHGGVLAYLADNAVTFAAGSVPGGVVTAGVEVHYLRPARESTLRVRAAVVQQSAWLATCAVEIDLVAEGRPVTHCVSGHGTVVVTESR